MKYNLILYSISIIFLFQSCKPLSIIDSYEYSYYILNQSNKFNNTKEIKALKSNVYYNNSFVLFSKKNARYNYDYDFIKKQLDLTRGKDTMSIFCNCGSVNYFFKNIEFKKGSFVIDHNDFYIHGSNKMKEIEGKAIKTPIKFQNILFKDYEIVYPLTRTLGPDRKWIRKDFTLKDIKFKVIDFSDTINVKLIPITKEDFWSNYFIPKNLKE